MTEKTKKPLKTGSKPSAPTPKAGQKKSVKKPVQVAKKVTKPVAKKPTTVQPAQKTPHVKKSFIIKKEPEHVMLPSAPVSTVVPPETIEKMQKELKQLNETKGKPSDQSELPIVSFYRTTDFLHQLRGTKL